MYVVTAAHWKSNAELIEDVASLYLRRDMLALDATYGRGVWWKNWRPDNLMENRDEFDFRKIPYADNSFGLVAFDPPYISMGSRDKSQLPEFMDRYGLRDASRTPVDLHYYNMDGLTEVHRVLRNKGLALVKCMDYIRSGRFVPASYWLHSYATEVLDFKLVDRFLHITSPRPQPPGRRQVHARNNVSTLFVLRK